MGQGKTAACWRCCSSHASASVMRSRSSLRTSRAPAGARLLAAQWIRSVSRLLLLQVVQAGANSIYGISFTVDNPRAVEDQAKSLLARQGRFIPTIAFPNRPAQVELCHHLVRQGLQRKALVASEDEVRMNPRARSAKLRIAERTDAPAHHDDPLQTLLAKVPSLDGEAR